MSESTHHTRMVTSYSYRRTRFKINVLNSWSYEEEIRWAADILHLYGKRFFFKWPIVTCKPWSTERWETNKTLLWNSLNPMKPVRWFQSTFDGTRNKCMEEYRNSRKYHGMTMCHHHHTSNKRQYNTPMEIHNNLRYNPSALPIKEPTLFKTSL